MIGMIQSAELTRRAFDFLKISYREEKMLYEEASRRKMVNDEALLES